MTGTSLRTLILVGETLYFAITVHDPHGVVHGWGRWATAIALGVFAFLSCASDEARHQEMERYRWDD